MSVLSFQYLDLSFSPNQNCSFQHSSHIMSLSLFYAFTPHILLLLLTFVLTLPSSVKMTKPLDSLSNTFWTGLFLKAVLIYYLRSYIALSFSTIFSSILILKPAAYSLLHSLNAQHSLPQITHLWSNTQESFILLCHLSFTCEYSTGTQIAKYKK